MRSVLRGTPPGDYGWGMGIDQLDGTTAIVTGGASGIGRATCRALALNGSRVIVTDVDDVGGAAVAEEVGGDFHHLDVADPAAWAQALEAVGSVDIAFLNAGVTTLPPGSGLGTADTHLTSLREADYRRIMAINVDGVVFGARAVAGPMAARGRGVIVATASLAGLIGFPPDPMYAVTKHAVIGLVRSIGAQLAPDGVSVHAICPGITDTAILADEAKLGLREVGFPIMPPEQIAEAVLHAIRSADTGVAWVCQAGRGPIAFEFRQVPGPRMDDGSAPAPPPEVAGNR